MINMEQDMTVCGEAEEAGKAFELVGTLQPDVAVVDIADDVPIPRAPLYRSSRRFSSG